MTEPDGAGAGGLGRRIIRTLAVILPVMGLGFWLGVAPRRAPPPLPPPLAPGTSVPLRLSPQLSPPTPGPETASATRILQAVTGWRLEGPNAPGVVELKTSSLPVAALVESYDAQAVAEGWQFLPELARLPQAEAGHARLRVYGRAGQIRVVVIDETAGTASRQVTVYESLAGGK